MITPWVFQSFSVFCLLCVHTNSPKIFPGELIGIFGGKWWRLCFDLSFCLSLAIVLWDYNVLLGVVLTRTFPIPSISETCNVENDNSESCYNLYAFWVCIFFVWTVCITLIDFQHQKWFGFHSFSLFLRVRLGLTVYFSLSLSLYQVPGDDDHSASVDHRDNGHHLNRPHVLRVVL